MKLIKGRTYLYSDTQKQVLITYQNSEIIKELFSVKRPDKIIKHVNVRSYIFVIDHIYFQAESNRIESIDYVRIDKNLLMRVYDIKDLNFESFNNIYDVDELDCDIWN